MKQAQQQTDQTNIVANKIFQRGFKPPPVLTVSEWADRYRFLTTGTSGEPGPYQTKRTPYMKEIMDSLSPMIKDERGRVIMNPIRCVVFMKGSQVGGTDAALNWIGHGMTQYPGPDFAVHPTVENGERWSKIKLDAMIAACPELQKLISKFTGRTSGNEILRKDYIGGSLTISGSNSAAGLRQISVRRVLLDDMDGFATDAGGEGSPIILIQKRQTSFIDAMTFMVSTPTTDGLSQIQKAYADTDQREYHVPCLACGELDKITWDKIIYDEQKPQDARYQCQQCGHLHTNADKTKLLAWGRWVATATAKYPNWKGYHLSALYLPPGWTSWGDQAQEFQQAEGHPENMRAFVNTVLGETWKDDTSQEMSPDSLIARREPYSREELPDGVIIITAGVDVQGDRIEIQIDGYGVGMEYWLIDHIIIHGDPAVVDIRPSHNNVTIWRQAINTLTKPYRHPRFGNMIPLATAIDTGGNNTMAVYTFCKSASRMINNLWAIKGNDGKRPIWPRHARRSARGKLPLFIVGVDGAKQNIYSTSLIKEAGPGFRHYPEWCPPDYFQQLFAERKNLYWQNGHPRERWILQSGRRNEALDLSVYSLAALQGLISAGIDLNARAEKLNHKYPTRQEHIRPKKQRERMISNGIA